MDRMGTAGQQWWSASAKAQEMGGRSCGTFLIVRDPEIRVGQPADSAVMLS